MYAMFGHLLLSMILLLVIISLLSILSTYLQLERQDPQWWWRSFIVGASGGIYIAAYCLCLIVMNMNLKDFASDASVFIYVTVIACSYSVLAGAVSTQASYFFVC